MKAKLTFEYDTDNADELIEINRIKKSLDIALCIMAIKNQLRINKKVGKDCVLIEDIEEVISDYNIDLDELLS